MAQSSVPHMCAGSTLSTNILLTAFSQSVHENRIYSLKMHCGDQYPDKPPTIQFINEVNLPCVNPKNGVVSYLERYSLYNSSSKWLIE
jgi:ubiquitin-protein ligase